MPSSILQKFSCISRTAAAKTPLLRLRMSQPGGARPRNGRRGALPTRSRLRATTRWWTRRLKSEGSRNSDLTKAARTFALSWMRGNGAATGWGVFLRQFYSDELKLMGTPFREYTFSFHVGPYLESGGGGMEHANCTAIGAASVESAVTIAAHEFFHAWNVKRIRPQTLEPVDFTKEQYTRALWFAEGVTNTYASYTLERSGIWPKERFYADLAAQISELDSRPAHLWQSVEESSLDAWLEKYDDYRQPERSISYYNKGQIVGEMLDLAIRNATDGHKSLDAVITSMNEAYAKQGKYYDDSDSVRAAAEEVTGTSLDDFFRGYISGVEEIPYDKFLGAAGLELKVETHRIADLGFWTAGGRGGGATATVSQVVPGSTAGAAGLPGGDVLLELNGETVPAFFPQWVRQHSPGEIVKLRIHRDGKELDISFALGSNETKRYSISELAHVSDRQKRIREGWLRGTVN